MATPVYVETSRSWSFASALEWPGWCRHAKGEADPVGELRAVAARYGAALARGGVDFEPPVDLEVVAFYEGDSGTAWGVPSIVPPQDHEPLDAAEAERQLAILQAGWAAFDAAVDAAAGHELRKGPRGGGRDVPRILAHCLEADKVYLSKLGSRRARIASDEWHVVEADIRARAVEAFRDRAADRPVREPSRTQQRWPLRWYARYVTWHNLTHAWDIEDRRLD